MRMKRFIPVAAIATALAVPAAASASVTVNPDGTGFVGKGNVQTVFNWKNKQLQDNAINVKFSGAQSVTQSLSQNVSQVLTLTGVQNGQCNLEPVTSVEWGAWDTDDTNADTDGCFNQGNNLVITSHAFDLDAPVVDGQITDGDPVPSADVVPGDVDYSAPIKGSDVVSVTDTTYGPMVVSATNPLNGVTKALL